MSFNSMVCNFSLAAGFAYALFCGCSADGSTSMPGVGGSTHATGGTGGNVSNDYQPVSATYDSGSNTYTLQMGPIKMVINGGKGARIVEYSYNGSNVLTGPDVNSTNYGSTFWPSPQSSWYSGSTWPPIAAIDTAAYTGSVDANNVITLTSPAATLGSVANSQFTVTKQFTPVPSSGAIDVTYTITNTSSSVSITVAPWEVSRVKGTGGLTFFGKGSDTPRFASGTDTTNFVVSEADGIYWYQCTTLATTASKCFADGAGWIAHVTADNILFLLTYPDIQPSQAATGEAEVEFYNNQSDGNYVEIEPQGASALVTPNTPLPWTVRWKLRQVPSNVSVAIGSADLEAFAQQQRGQ